VRETVTGERGPTQKLKEGTRKTKKPSTLGPLSKAKGKEKVRSSCNTPNPKATGGGERKGHKKAGLASNMNKKLRQIFSGKRAGKKKKREPAETRPSKKGLGTPPISLFRRGRGGGLREISKNDCTGAKREKPSNIYESRPAS